MASQSAGDRDGRKAKLSAPDAVNDPVKVFFLILSLLLALPCAGNHRKYSWRPPWMHKPNRDNGHNCMTRSEKVLRLQQSPYWGPILRGLTNDLAAWWAWEENFDGKSWPWNSVPPNTPQLSSGGPLNILSLDTHVSSVSGLVGRAGRFTALLSEVYGADASALQFKVANDKTFAFWFKFSKSGRILTKGLEYLLTIDTATRKLNLNNFIGGTITHPLVLTPDVWHLAMFWRSGGTGNAFLQLDNEAPISGAFGNVQSDAHLLIGSAGIGFGGDLDEMAIWNRALSANERYLLFNSRLGLTYTDLLGKPCRSLECCEPSACP